MRRPRRQSGVIAASLAYLLENAACAAILKNTAKRGPGGRAAQLMERVNRPKAHQNKRRVRIKSEMHQSLRQMLLRPGRISHEVVNQTRYVGKSERPAKASPANETEGFRRRGSVGFVANLFWPEVSSRL
jgi:hypothetical protein